MPSLFIGHGSPMNAIEENNITKSWNILGKTLPKPRAILVISAHWYIPKTQLTYQDINTTIHDFFGFPEALANYDYKSFSSKEIATSIKNSLSDSIDIELSENTWGLDHGAWSILTHIYPTPDMPILQLSIDLTKPPIWHFELGQKLAPLRQQGIMIIGSGNIVHNLGVLSWHKPDSAYDWATEFDKLVINQINKREFEPLTNYLSLSPSAMMAVPTPEHYLPLLYILGTVQDNENIKIFNQIYQYGSLSMTSIITQ